MGTKLALELFALVEEILPIMAEEGIKEDNPIFKIVDYRNISDGDINEFSTKGKALFTVADTASGVRGVRRQRISDGVSVSVPTTMKIVRVYENLGRLLAGRVSFDDLVQGVANSFAQKVLIDAYTAISGITSATAGLNSTYVQSGSYNEGELLKLIGHVEAATNKEAKIYGTKTALRLIATASVSDEAKSDLYNVGHYGRFNGTEMIMLRQAHTPGTDTFVLNDAQFYILAGDDKPIKVVNEGTGLLHQRPALDSADMTEEYVYGQGFGTGVICAEKMGIYTVSEDN